MRSVSRGRNPGEDAVQETFLTAWTQIAKLRVPEAFPGWLRRIAIWQCHYRRRAKMPSADLETIIDGRNLETEIERGQLLAQVKEMLWALSLPHREILILHYLEDYSHAELSGFLEISEGAVRKRLHDARHRIRGVYDRWLKESPPTPPSRRIFTKPTSLRRNMTNASDCSGRTA